jgi:VWFA-related protein
MIEMAYNPTPLQPHGRNQSHKGVMKLRRLLTSCLATGLLISLSFAQTPPPQTPAEQEPGDVIRISTSLVQTDVVVTDKNDQIITDLQLNDFKVFENGKRQDVKFVQFVSSETPPEARVKVTVAGQPLEPEIARNLTAGELRRVFAFVVDDLTIPFEDIGTVRSLLTNFVENQMRDGDLVAIVRVIGGNGLVQQFTSDKRILRRAISQITPQLHAYSAFNNMKSADSINAELAQAVVEAGGTASQDAVSGANSNLDVSEDGTIRGIRALSTLSTASEVINYMTPLPGRKSLVLLSGGIPLFESSPGQVMVGGAPVTLNEGRAYLGNVNLLLRQLTDRAGRAGVVINTMDVRGLKASRGVSRFTDPGNEASSHFGSGSTTGGGRLPNMATFDNLALDTLSGHQGLGLLADTTGGVSVVNSDDFAAGLQKVMARSSYYLIAYRPSEPFDGKFHKLEVKVERPGARVYTRKGYYAAADAPAKTLTREQTLIKAAMSPLAKRDLNVTGTMQYRYTPENHADVDINLVIDANGLDFKTDSTGKQHATFEVVGFVVNNLGKTQDGFSQTVTTNFSPEEYSNALKNGISFTGHADLPPGSYQTRAVVRDEETGRMGTVSQYLEVADLTKKRLTMSSIFLYGIDVAKGDQATPIPLNAMRQLPRRLDVRYAAVIYNAKLEGGKPQLRSRFIISRDNKILFQEPDQPVSGSMQNGQMAKVGQFSLAKARPGRYLLTLVITDPLADKKERMLIRSVDLNLID